METDGTFLRLKITIDDILKMLIISFICLLVFMTCIIFVIYSLFMLIHTNIVLTLFLSIKLISVLISLFVLFWIAGIFFIQSIVDLKFFLKHQGIFFYMDKNEITFYSFKTKVYKSKTWSNFDEVGCYKQETKKLRYEYQIKFIDSDVYSFDLRGTISTKDFVDKIEEFYINYA